MPDSSSGRHTFVITVDGTNYAVELDGEQLAAEVPLFSAEGHVGFTTTQRIVTYSEIVVEK